MRFWIISLLLAAAVLAASWCAAESPNPGCGTAREAWESDNEAVVLRSYATPGKLVQGILAEQYSSLSLDVSIYKDRFLASPVVLDSQLPYPYPYSHPVFIVVVGRFSSFSIEVAAQTGELIEEFSFDNIESGIYRFGFEKPVWIRGNLFVTLLHNGSMVGRKRMPAAAFNGVK